MKRILILAIPVMLISCAENSGSEKKQTAELPEQEWVKPAGKDSMLLLTDRPPNIETPLKYFLEDYTLCDGICPDCQTKLI